MTQLIGREGIMDGLGRTASGHADTHVWRLEGWPGAVLKFFFTESGEPVAGGEITELERRYGETAYYDGCFSPDDAQQYLNNMKQAKGEE